MNRKTSLIFALLIAACLLLLLLPIRLPFSSVHPHQAVPKHTALFFSATKAQLDMVANRDSTGELLNLFVPNSLGKDLAQFEDLLGEQLELRINAEFTVTVNPTKKLGIDLLFLLPAGRGVSLEKLLSSNTGWNLRTFTFQNQEVITLRKGEEEFSFAKFRNLLVFARHAYLVENAISQLKSPGQKICKQAGFKKLRTAENVKHLSFFINLGNVPSQFASLLEPTYSNRLRSVQSMGDWLRLDLPIGPQETISHGAFLPNKNNPIIKASLAAEASPNSQYLQFIPDNIAGFLQLNTTGLGALYADAVWSNSYAPWVGGELVVGIGESTESNENERFLLLASKDDQAAEKALSELVGTAENASFDFQLFRVHQIPAPPFFQQEKNKTVFATSLGEYVLFANTKAGVERWLGKYLAGQTCSSNVGLLRSKAVLDDKINGFLYLDGIKGWQHISPFLSEDYLRNLGRNPVPFEKMAASLVWEKGLCKLTFNAQAHPTKEQLPANILWSVPLAADAAAEPFISINPQTGEQDVLISDRSNNLYLISRSGRLIWKKQLPEAVSSDFFHLDFYNNGNGQFAFSTRTAIYVLDRQGEYLDGFPLALQVPATNGVTVVDFFQSHDYNFFIACENGKAYGFDEKGSPIEGWRPNEGIGRVEHPILHFQADGKDFLVLLDILGNLNVYKKNGSPRFPKLNFDEPLMQQPDFQVSKKSSRIVAATDEGMVHVTNLAGSHFKLHLKVGTNEDVHFLFADVLGDERKDYIALSGKEMAVYSYDGNAFKKMLDHQYLDPQTELFPVSISKGRKSYIGTVKSKNKQISLVDGNGKMPGQFPLEGTTPFFITDLAGDGKLVIVTGNGDRVTAYALK